MILRHSWLGNHDKHLNVPFTTHCGNVVLGCYGGNAQAGAYKNEDGALVLTDDDDDWTFAILLDAHNSSQSAATLLKTIAAHEETIAEILKQASQQALPALHSFLVEMFSAEEFRKECRRIQGETACLICAQKEQFLFWLSVGDCVTFLLHPELARLGQFALNQRQFYEWIGQVNTFDLRVPCYTTGVRELRQGNNCIVMVTDGLLEFGNRPFADGATLFEVFMHKERDDNTLRSAVERILQRVHVEGGSDSATVVCWETVCPTPGARPTS